MNNENFDNKIFKIISLITSNHHFFKSLSLQNLIINIINLNILELKSVYIENNNLEIYNKIYKDYNIIQNNKDLIMNYNQNLNNMKKIQDDIILNNLDSINNLYIELLEYIIKKN